jgi:hypothetical protein
MTIIISSCCRPLLYKPRFDPTPVLSLNIPKYIDTLEVIPRNETVVVNGFNKNVGRRQPDNVKEMFHLDIPDGTIHFTLYFDATSAGKSYQFWKKNGTLNNPVFYETGKENHRAYVLHVEQPRSDPEGFCQPMGYYTSSCGFQLQNLLVTIGVHHDERESESLNQAIKILADLIKDDISQKNNDSQQDDGEVREKSGGKD